MYYTPLNEFDPARVDVYDLAHAIRNMTDTSKMPWFDRYLQVAQANNFFKYVGVLSNGHIGWLVGDCQDKLWVARMVTLGFSRETNRLALTVQRQPVMTMVTYDGFEREFKSFIPR